MARAHTNGSGSRGKAPRRSGLRACVAAAALALLVSLAAPLVATPPPAAAQTIGAGTLELIPTGSLIIPMDTTLQGSATTFNLRAYGMAQRLLWAGVPLKWVIQPGKAKDGVDFNATARRISPTATAAASLNFSGGPFVVHRDFAVAARNVVTAYNATGANVNVYETTADATLPVRYTLTHLPKVAVFNDGGNAAIHTAFLAAAGFEAQAYSVIPAATLITINADACFTIGTEPHWKIARNGNSDEQTNAVRRFVEAGGNLLAECDGIATYENNANFGRFQTTTGIVDGAASTPYSFPSPDNPYSQFIGGLADQSGSVSDYAPAAGGGYRPGIEIHARKSSVISGSDGSLGTRASVVRLNTVTTPAGGFVFYLGGHEYTTADLPNINGIRLYLNAVMTPTSRPSSCGLTLTPRTVAGTVYEDVNGDSVLTDGVGRPGVPVRLYRDANNNGLVDAGDTFLIATTTDAAGQYSFNVTVESTGSNYLVAADSKSVSPAAGLIAGRGVGWAEQTFGDDPATPAFDPGSRFGGRTPATSDNFNAADTAHGSNNYQHLARVNVASASVTNAHFGFSFNVVTNTRAGDTADDDAANTSRTVQGSLRQFVQNANAITGANHMRFVPAVAANAGGATYWQIAVTSALAAVIDASTTFDGTAYQSANGTVLRDTNTGSLGAGGTVGTDAVALAQVARPELEILGTSAVAVGLDLQANNSIVRRLAIRGFGSTPNSDSHANVRLGNNFTGALVEQNFLGLTANASTFTTGAAASTGDNLRSAGADNGTVRNNLVGYSAGKGIQLGGGSTGWLVEANEVRSNGVGNSNLDGLDIENSGTNTVRANLFAANEAAGVDMFNSSGSNIVENNTVTGNGIGPNANIESPGVRLYGTGNTVRRNVVHANFGAGVLVTSGSTGNLITQNSVYANGTITNKAGAGPSGQIGIDLLAAANSQTTGTAPFVTVNDSGDPDAGGNNLLNFPVITSARIISGNLVLAGYARPGAEIELFVAAPDPSGFGEGQTYLVTLTEGSAADTDTTTGTYTSPVNGLNVGTDTTNLFRFTIPAPAGVAVGTVLTSTATLSGNTSEFGGNITVLSSPPDVRLEKRCTSPADCESAHQTPGTELTYTITFENAGGSAAQSLTIVDIIPFSVDLPNSLLVRSTDFKVGSMSFSPGTTGLTLAPGDAKHYSDAVNFPAPSPPWSPSAPYAPAGAPGTFDPNVTYVSWTLTGSMPPGTSGSVSFTVRIR